MHDIVILESSAGPSIFSFHSTSILKPSGCRPNCSTKSLADALSHFADGTIKCVYVKTRGLLEAINWVGIFCENLDEKEDDDE